MTDYQREAIRFWQQVVEAAVNEEVKIGGDVQVHQETVSPEVDVDNYVVVTLRKDGPGNFVSMNCINRFSDESWAIIDIKKPKHGEKVKLWLNHSQLGKRQRLFEFLVDENERLDVILGKHAIKDLEEYWGNKEGYIRVIRSTKHPKGNVDPVSLELMIMSPAPDRYQDQPSPAAETAQSAEHQRDKEAERERRKARRQASSSASTESVGSKRSQGSGTSAN